MTQNSGRSTFLFVVAISVFLSTVALPWVSSDQVRASAQRTQQDGSFKASALTTLHSTTNLTWQRGRSGTRLTWDDALTYCDKLVLAGHDDWRLPTQSEADSIRTSLYANSGYIDRDVFQVGANAWIYWTHTPDPYDSRRAWVADYTELRDLPNRLGGSWVAKHYGQSVRCVRGPSE